MSKLKPKTVRTCLLAAGLSLGFATATFLAQSGAAFAQDDAEELEIVFVPPVDGAPAERIGAGTRGSGSPSAQLKLMVPKGGALTGSQSPALYWWNAKPYDGMLTVTLTRDGTDTPLLNLEEKVTLQGGLNTISLGDVGVRLKAGDIYRWAVSIVSGNRTVTQSSYIEFRKSDMSATDSSAKMAKALAGAGLWYDAFALVAKDPKLSGARMAMLKQVGIKLPN
ncbi:MAG: DUF928 domain-containing protein [Pseudomonadota bacterium]